ncbi:MAG: hypothetical protein HY067_02445 [Betaproteobacteria bacterium]|nr:hypothetical protein [Betaproteobacteria bacterium]
MIRKPMPDVLVVIPGILGSELKRQGRDAWGFSAGAGLHALTTLGDSIGALRLTADSSDPEQRVDDVEATRILPDLHLIPYLWKIDGYSSLTESLRRTFDVEHGVNYFEFPYDWRRDNRVAAKQLQRVSREWLRRWRESSGNNGAKLIIVAHSMGGLVARYFLEALEGWPDAKALVTFGTPFRGSVNALRTLVEGIRKGPFGIVDLSAFVRSLPSVYQLLPTYPCLQTVDGQLVHLSDGPAIAHVEAGKVLGARDFHAEIRQAIDRHLDDDIYRRGRYRVIPVVGTHQETLQSARMTGGENIEFASEHAGHDLGGDGTVPRISATPVELSNAGREAYVSTCHASLQNASAVQHHVCDAITALDLDLSSWQYRAISAGPVKVALHLEDAYWNDESVSLRVLADSAASPALYATVVEADSGAEVARIAFPPSKEGWLRAEVPPLPAGVYRCTVEGEAGVSPVADVFSVYDRGHR